MAFLKRSFRRRVFQLHVVSQKFLSDGHQRGNPTWDPFVKDPVQSCSLKNVELVGPKQAFSVKSNWELFRGWMVFKMFTYNSLVDNSFKVFLIIARCSPRSGVTEKGRGGVCICGLIWGLLTIMILRV